MEWDEFDPNTAEVMKKIQKIVVSYRRSPVKNDTLQKLVIDERGRELKLKKDCKTRWNSVLAMLANFLKIRVQIHDDLEKRGLESLFPTESELTHIINLTKALKIIAFLATKLGARDVDLAKADKYVEFALEKLDLLTSSIAINLRDHLFERINERRLKDVSTLLGYLKNPKFQFGRNLRLEYSNKTEITNLAFTLYTRLFPKGVDEGNDTAIPEVNAAEQGICDSAKFKIARPNVRLTVKTSF